ncbi:MAG TPA: CDGSH iron-sulfur domain-containing protein [Nocardioides sp.]|nr:CDGSH iron-sulfur domain-containing protein [Nocardioides sp.]
MTGRMTGATSRRVTVVECPGGPLLVRGADEVVGADGTVAAVERSVVALCRCGRSERMPWCDASHRDKRRRKRRDTPPEKQETDIDQRKER